jgi:hypothetical protein
MIGLGDERKRKNDKNEKRKEPYHSRCVDQENSQTGFKDPTSIQDPILEALREQADLPGLRHHQARPLQLDDNNKVS